MTIIATPKASNANSYVDLVFADAYFATKFGADTWTSFTLEQQEQLVVSGTNALDLFLYGGQKTTRTQALEWPRDFLTDRAGYTLDNSVVPLQIRKATCEMSFWIWTEEDRLLSDTSLLQVEDFKAGPLTLKVKANAIVVPPIVEQLIQSIGPGALISTTGRSQQVSIVR